MHTYTMKEAKRFSMGLNHLQGADGQICSIHRDIRTCENLGQQRSKEHCSKSSANRHHNR